MGERFEVKSRVWVAVKWMVAGKRAPWTKLVAHQPELQTVKRIDNLLRVSKREARFSMGV